MSSLDNSSPKKNKKTILISTGIFLLMLFALFAFFITNRFIECDRQEPKPDTVKNDVKLPFGFVTVKIPPDKNEEFTTFFIQDTLTTTKTPVAAHALYFPKNESIQVPSFLSDYSFFSVHNFHWSYQYYSLGKTSLSNTIYKKSEESETKNLKLVKYHSDNEHWATGEYKNNNLDEYELNAGFLFHSDTVEELDELITFADQNIEVKKYFSEDKWKEVPKRSFRLANYIENSGKYRFYFPQGYKLKTNSSQNNIRLSNVNTTGEMCLSLKSISKEPCGFSTSGCTCCNTGCSLLDVAMFADPLGKIQLSGILDKGDSGVVRFLYGETFEHPWIYFTSSYACGPTLYYKKGLLDFLHLIESIERTY
jgi:hypothetical protein